jgi:hypothetical protein
MAKRVPCKGCGAPMIWAETEDGKAIPLDPSAPVYRVLSHDASGTPKVKLVPLEDGEREVMVSHFKTCPKAGDFGRGRR